MYDLVWNVLKIFIICYELRTSFQNTLYYYHHVSNIHTQQISEVEKEKRHVNRVDFPEIHGLIQVRYLLDTYNNDQTQLFWDFFEKFFIALLMRLRSCVNNQNRNPITVKLLFLISVLIAINVQYIKCMSSDTAIGTLQKTYQTKMFLYDILTK